MLRGGAANACQADGARRNAKQAAAGTGEMVGTITGQNAGAERLQVSTLCASLVQCTTHRLAFPASPSGGVSPSSQQVIWPAVAMTPAGARLPQSHPASASAAWAKSIVPKTSFAIPIRCLRGNMR